MLPRHQHYSTASQGASRWSLRPPPRISPPRSCDCSSGKQCSVAPRPSVVEADLGRPDEAIEARLHPGRWGFIRFAGRKKTLVEQLLDNDDEDTDKDIEDVVDDLEEDLF